MYGIDTNCTLCKIMAESEFNLFHCTKYKTDIPNCFKYISKHRKKKIYIKRNHEFFEMGTKRVGYTSYSDISFCRIHLTRMPYMFLTNAVPCKMCIIFYECECSCFC